MSSTLLHQVRDKKIQTPASAPTPTDAFGVITVRIGAATPMVLKPIHRRKLHLLARL
jgi:hypothetical protein